MADLGRRFLENVEERGVRGALRLTRRHLSSRTSSFLLSRYPDALTTLHGGLHYGLAPGRNPVLTARDVTDYGACQYVADPFMVGAEGTWHLFFEVYNPNREPTAVIGHAVSEDPTDGWEYDRVVVNTGTHVSFPYVFGHEDRFFMILDYGCQGERKSAVELFTATRFPTDWEHHRTLLVKETARGDSVLFDWRGTWWLFTEEPDAGLCAYHSSDLAGGEWVPHASNPIALTDERPTRPAGRPIVAGDRIHLFLQDCSRVYGEKVVHYEVTELTETEYEDREGSPSPLIEGSGLVGWNSGRMHHVDPHRTAEGWACAVDGDSMGPRALFGARWSIGVLTDADGPGCATRFGDPPGSP